MGGYFCILSLLRNFLKSILLTLEIVSYIYLFYFSNSGIIYCWWCSGIFNALIAFSRDNPIVSIRFFTILISVSTTKPLSYASWSNSLNNATFSFLFNPSTIYNIIDLTVSTGFFYDSCNCFSRKAFFLHIAYMIPFTLSFYFLTNWHFHSCMVV